MAASDPVRALMRVADAPQRCGDCAVFALLEDVIRAALLQGGPAQIVESLPRGRPGGGHRAIARGAERRPVKRLAKVRGTVQGCLAAIDQARKAITAIARDGDGVTTAAQLEIRHHCGIIQRRAQKAREMLAAVR